VPHPGEHPGAQFDVAVHWRMLVAEWAERRQTRAEAGGDSISLEVGATETGRGVTVRFTTTSRLLVAFMTDSRILRGGELATAAAAANAWNVEQLVPMLSVWEARGPEPRLAGVSVLPLVCTIRRDDFDALVTSWVERAHHMFLRCHQLFGL
jgi:hypothetical protein